MPGSLCEIICAIVAPTGTLRFLHRTEFHRQPRQFCTSRTPFLLEMAVGIALRAPFSLGSSDTAHRSTKAINADKQPDIVIKQQNGSIICYL
jgi:hypothetical protein